MISKLYTIKIVPDNKYFESIIIIIILTFT